jgi:hypothetical protein
MPREDPSLGFLAAKKIKLMIWCSGCFRNATLDPEPLIEKFGHSYPILRMKKHLRCKVCGKQRCSVYW